MIGVANNGSDEERSLALASGMCVPVRGLILFSRFDCISRSCTIFTFDALVREIAETGPSQNVPFS
jgi:hypothetical protein